MAMLHYTAKVHDIRILELPEEATELGLKPGDEVEVSVMAAPHPATHNGTPKGLTPQERAQAYRAWAESHSRDLPLLSDEAISRDSIYGERG